MKNNFFTFLFLGLGAGMWLLTSRSHTFPVKNWDAKFDSLLRNELSNLGLKNDDIESSIHQIMKDEEGEWVMHSISLDGVGDDLKNKLVALLRNGGAVVSEVKENGVRSLLVKRGQRIYQKISIRN